MSLLKVILVLCAFESGGQEYAVGAHGEGGILQTKRIVVDDVNRIYGTSFAYADRFDKEKALRICELYLAFYATQNRLGREPTELDACRIWRGGPDGWKNKSTVAYANQIKPWLTPQHHRILLPN